MDSGDVRLSVRCSRRTLVQLDELAAERGVASATFPRIWAPEKSRSLPFGFRPRSTESE
jgi:hypothetical protein